MNCPRLRPALWLPPLLALFACTGTEYDGPTAPAALIETTVMHNDTTITRQIPPIDAEAPATYQTATFALG